MTPDRHALMTRLHDCSSQDHWQSTLGLPLPRRTRKLCTDAETGARASIAPGGLEKYYQRSPKCMPRYNLLVHGCHLGNLKGCQEGDKGDGQSAKKAGEGTQLQCSYLLCCCCLPPPPPPPGGGPSLTLAPCQHPHDTSFPSLCEQNVPMECLMSHCWDPQNAWQSMSSVER